MSLRPFQALEAAMNNDDTKSIVAGSVAGATLNYMGGTGTITFRPFSDNRQVKEEALTHVFHDKHLSHHPKKHN